MAAAASIERSRSPLQEIQVKEYSGACSPDELYLVTNEEDQAQTLDALQKIGFVGNTYLGTSALFNLNAASVSPRIEYIVIVDRSEVVQFFWEQIDQIIRETTDRDKAYSKIEAMVKKYQDRFFGNSGLASVLRGPQTPAKYYLQKFEMENIEELSFLSSDERYEKIRKIFLNDNFRFFRMNFNTPESFVDLAKEFKKKDLVVRTVYASNVAEYCVLDLYAQALAPFINTSTNFIDTCSRRSTEEKMIQRVRYLSNPLEIKQFLLRE